MNIYRHAFFVTCPVDGALIRYDLRVKSRRTIMAEDIERHCSASEPTFHEDMADKLCASLGGRQTLVATHGGVTIKTRRGNV